MPTEPEAMRLGSFAAGISATCFGTSTQYHIASCDAAGAASARAHIEIHKQEPGPLLVQAAFSWRAVCPPGGSDGQAVYSALGHQAGLRQHVSWHFQEICLRPTSKAHTMCSKSHKISEQGSSLATDTCTYACCAFLQIAVNCTYYRCMAM